MHLLSSNFSMNLLITEPFGESAQQLKKLLKMYTGMILFPTISAAFCLFTCIIPLSRLYIQFQLNFVFGLFFECLHLLRIDSRQLIQRRYAESSKKFFSGSE